MGGVAVFELHGVLLPIQRDICGIPKGHGPDRIESNKLTFTGHLLMVEHIVKIVPPRSSVWIRDGLKCLVRENVVGGIDERSVRSSGSHITKQIVLEWLDAVENVPDVVEVPTAMIGAEIKGIWIVGDLEENESANTNNFTHPVHDAFPNVVAPSGFDAVIEKGGDISLLMNSVQGLLQAAVRVPVPILRP